MRKPNDVKRPNPTSNLKAYRRRGRVITPMRASAKGRKDAATFGIPYRHPRPYKLVTREDGSRELVSMRATGPGSYDEWKRDEAAKREARR